jgi:hypothetical protein
MNNSDNDDSQELHNYNPRVQMTHNIPIDAPLPINTSSFDFEIALAEMVSNAYLEEPRNQIHEQEKEKEDEESSDCCICFEELNKDNEVITSCNHKFCQKCIKIHEKNVCPLCRSKIKSVTIPFKDFVYDKIIVEKIVEKKVIEYKIEVHERSDKFADCSEIYEGMNNDNVFFNSIIDHHDPRISNLNRDMSNYKKLLEKRNEEQSTYIFNTGIQRMIPN